MYLNIKQTDQRQLFRREPHSSSKQPSSQNVVTSLCFDDEGGLLLTSENDNSMQIYNVKEGKHHKTHLSQKYGCMHAIFSHSSGCIIHSSTKINSKCDSPFSSESYLLSETPLDI